MFDDFRLNVTLKRLLCGPLSNSSSELISHFQRRDRLGTQSTSEMKLLNLALLWRITMSMKRNLRLGFFLYLSLSILAIVLLAPRIAVSQNVNIDRVVAELEPEIRRTMLAGNIPSASIALVSGNQVVWTGAYGNSNLWARTTATPNTVYLIGSTFKTMSAVALLQQMEQGKFKLDDRVNDYLTDFKIQGEDPQHPVTFRHLLTHTSGMPGDFGGFPVWGDSLPPSLEDYLRKSLKVTKPPMTSVVYSNMAYTLIGYLVQKFSGVPYKKYIQDHIFTPLELTSTRFEPRPDMDERLSISYTVNEAGSQVAAVRLRASVWPAGIVYG